MAHNDKNSPIGDPTLIIEGHVNEDPNSISANNRDQMLLKALQDLIIGVINPKQKSNMNQIHLGPEAEKLITALQDFISSIVIRSQSEAQNKIEAVYVQEEDKLRVSDPNNDTEGDESHSREGPLLGIPSPESGDAAGNRNSIDLDTLEKPRSTFDEKLLRALREHVFNKMPIRLLCFEPRGSGFQIVLLERGAIFARLALTLQREMPEEFHHRETLPSAVETDNEIISQLLSKYAGYAILSHTWLRTAPGEVTYGDWNKGLFDAQGPGYQKLVNFCKAAWNDHRLAFGWMDTVCINKESSSELDESIRSMFKWYSRAAVCITYLAETATLSNMHRDPWFTRGWTLQELLAPNIIKFYNGHWRQLGEHWENDKEAAEITQKIEQATTITKPELDNIHFKVISISRRMQMAANREVTREEDMAYSLMGIFDVSISTAYGEGASRAFFRLLQEILNTSRDVLDILNWAGNPYSSNNAKILPSSPRHYLNRSSNQELNLRMWPLEPLTLSHMGLRVSLILMPGISTDYTEPLYDAVGDYNGQVNISPLKSDRHYDWHTFTDYNLLDNRISGSDGRKSQPFFQMTFAVFNFSGLPDQTIALPKTCIAIGLMCYEHAGKRSVAGYTDIARTSKPIVFKLRNTNYENASGLGYWDVKISELARHGMQLINMYL